MTKVKVVIGANFGDEGKGLMTDYFCSKAAERKENCLVVCSNGGAQRGHTVITPEGVQHVFHHFGSGVFVGADTYLSEKFILNPIIFRQEYGEFSDLGYRPKVYINRKCSFSTPYDMMMNQIIEDNRGANRHGSCGVGIWETIVRNEMHNLSLSISDYSDNNIYKEKVFNYIKDVRDNYCPERLMQVGIGEIPECWKKIFYSEFLLERYFDDFFFMLKHIEFADDNILKEYQNIVFENGQGLLLDQNRKEFGENTTPSNTGLKNPKEIINKITPDSEVEICYVTRTYLTRHGAGRFDTECSKEIINPRMNDETNITNPYQGSLRYGKIDLKDLTNRIIEDFGYKNDWRLSLAITHLNETDGSFVMSENVELSHAQFIKRFNCIYQSDGKTREYITIK